MIAIRGIHSVIAEELIKLLPEDEKVFPVRRDSVSAYADNWPADRFLFCQGLIRPRQIKEQTPAEREESFNVNAGQIMVACDQIIETNPHARICVLGSESGFAWSFDGAYAAAKAALHRYVETKWLRTPAQQLVCVSPGIIGDAGMTLRRADQHGLQRRRMSHPKQRFIEAAEVARLIHFCLYVDRGYLSGVVLRMNGGEHNH